MDELTLLLSFLCGVFAGLALAFERQRNYKEKLKIELAPGEAAIVSKHTVQGVNK